MPWLAEGSDQWSCDECGGHFSEREFRPHVVDRAGPQETLCDVCHRAYLEDLDDARRALADELRDWEDER